MKLNQLLLSFCCMSLYSFVGAMQIDSVSLASNLDSLNSPTSVASVSVEESLSCCGEEICHFVPYEEMNDLAKRKKQIEPKDFFKACKALECRFRMSKNK